MNYHLRVITCWALCACFGAVNGLAQTITRVSPTFGKVNTYIGIYGSGFTTSTKVYFGTIRATASLVGSGGGEQQIQATVPTGLTQPVLISVQNGTLQPFYSPSYFTNIGNGPFVTDFSPSTGNAGTTVTINGDNFSTVTSVKFNGVAAPFTATVVNRLTATVPAGITTGPITITSPQGTYITYAYFYPPPTVKSITPTNGYVGDSVKIAGTNFLGASGVEFGGISASYHVDNNNQITAMVPFGLTNGTIRVIAGGTSAFSSNSFAVLPVITGFSPGFGPAGTTVTIAGQALNAGSPQVFFQGAGSVKPTSSAYDQLVVTAPAAAVSGPVKVVTRNGSATTVNNFLYPAVITNIAPTKGFFGTAVTIYGKNFTNATQVTFGGVSTPFTVVNNQTVATTVPQGATSAPVKITTAAGSAESSSYFLLPPTILAVTPSSGLPGMSVTISGVFPDLVTNVTFNGAKAAITWSSNNAVQVTVPTNAISGPITCTALGGSTNSPGNFLVPPVIAFFSPVSGGAGTAVTITGSFPDGVTNVTFNGAKATISSNDKSTIKAVVPANASTGPVTVMAFGGSYSSPNSFLVLPGISGLNPSSGIVGSTVTISGTFPDPVTSVLFNGAEAEILSVTNTAITAIVPADATTGRVKVMTLGGTTTSASNYFVLPEIFDVEPKSAVAGTMVTISGRFADPVTNVLFNGASAVIASATNSSVKITVPTNATTGPITVRTLGGSCNSPADFLVPPVISGVTPGSGIAGTAVTINGSFPDGLTNLTFNGVKAVVSSSNSTSIKTAVPSDASSGPITVYARGGSAEVEFLVPPVVDSFSPSSGGPGTTVTINGSFPDTVTNVTFDGAVASISSATKTTVTVTVPDSASTGPITVVAKGGSDSSSGVFTVPSSITTVMPASGFVGTSVIIGGTFPDSVTNVAFNGVKATIVSATRRSIVAVVPANATTGKITVMSTSGAILSPYNFMMLPTITGVNPGAGIAGTGVIISGAFPDAVTNVSFNGAKAVINSAGNTAVSVTVPTNATTGQITLSTAGGTCASPSNFLVPPVIGAFTPTSGSAGTAVVINGSFPDTVTNVTFNGGASARITAATKTLVKVIVPDNFTSGPITVYTAGGSSTSMESFEMTGVSLRVAGKWYTNQTITIQWPTNAIGYKLQYRTNLVSAPWLTNSSNPTVIGSNNVLNIYTTNAERYYRLVK